LAFHHLKLAFHQLNKAFLKSPFQKTKKEKGVSIEPGQVAIWKIFIIIIIIIFICSDKNT